MKYGDRFPVASVPADHAIPIALRVNSPRSKISPEPFRRHGRVSLPRESANLVNAVPGILGSFEPFDPLRFGFLDRLTPYLGSKNKKPTNQLIWRWALRTKV